MNLIVFLLFELPRHAAAPFTWLPPALARITVGWVFLWTGWAKLQNLDQIVSFFESLGIPYPGLQAPFVASTELVCGALVLVGLLTRVAALPLIGTMVVAIATAQWPQVESAAGLFGLVESLYLVIFVWLAVEGGGPLSIDALVRRRLAESGRAAAPIPFGRAAGANH